MSNRTVDRAISIKNVRKRHHDVKIGTLGRFVTGKHEHGE